MSGAVPAVGDDGSFRGPNGQALVGGRRLTYRQARPWLRRSAAVVGVRPCGMEIKWLTNGEREAEVDRLRHAEGKDCNVAGDVLLYRLDDVPVVVVEERY